MLDNLTRRLSGIFAGLRSKGRLNEADVTEMLREVRVALLEADVNFKVAKDLIARIKEQAVGEAVFGSLTADQTIIKIVRDEVTLLLGGESQPRFNWSPSPPTVVLLCGLQGSGKTTTAAKLARWLLKEGKKPLLVACDVQRPAAVKQLEVLGEQIGVPVHSKLDGTRPPTIASEGVAKAKHLFLDTVIVDTAGRLQVDEALMQELREISRLVSPSETLLVLDSTTGQEAVNVAETFHASVPLTGAIFTKLDGDTRGGAVLSVRAATGVPVRFIGVGEQTDALEAFVPDRMAQRILGFGDILGIIEKAELAIDQGEAKQLESRMKSGNLDFNDMLSQFKTMRKMGPMKNILKMVPGLSAALPEDALDRIDEKRIDRIEAIILSMTPKERSNPDIINGSRRKRIAAGSGTSVEDLNNLIRQLYEMRKQMKQLSKMQARFGKGRRR
ncbi:MAG TPA: signal recognition particle protein [Fimbriimonadaceae bacterium]|nr:signal recognition particle protein [Fimbriimonadaceae bacterium]